MFVGLACINFLLGCPAVCWHDPAQVSFLASGLVAGVRGGEAWGGGCRDPG